ncbi:hypothetical protein ACA910_018562 [Epithemia clementina (nom. ined.)]
MYTDTHFAQSKSLRQNTRAQVYCTEFDWVKIYPMRSRKEVAQTFRELATTIGVPHTIIPDNAMELTAGDFKHEVHKSGALIRPIEAYTHNQNRAEATIQELRRMTRRALYRTGAPHVLWDDCMELQAEIRSHTALPLRSLRC